ncbi:recombinase family protein [Howardella ureilytica]
MAGRIQGITVEIGGDTTKLQTALKGVNTEIRNTQSQLRDVDKLLKLDPGNTELLAQKHRLPGDAVKETKEKLETLKTAAEQAEQALLDGVKNAEINCIIVKDFSRFARDYIELGSYLEQIFPFMGVRFISINDKYDSDQYSGNVADIDVNFKNLLYDLYSKDLSLKINALCEL